MTLADLETFLTHRLAQPLPGPAAQRRFVPRGAAGDWMPDAQPDSARHAAVLILLYPGAHQPALPLTVRHSRLARHAGQVSLPGGALDPGESPPTAALRETSEELGIAGDTLRLVGALSSLWVPVSNFLVFPFVAVADRPPVFRPDPREVETLLEVPVAHVRDRTRLRWTSGPAGDLDYPCFDLAGHQVWGATATILGEFANLFDAHHAPPER